MYKSSYVKLIFFWNPEPKTSEVKILYDECYYNNFYNKDKDYNWLNDYLSENADTLIRDEMDKDPIGIYQILAEFWVESNQDYFGEWNWDCELKEVKKMQSDLDDIQYLIEDEDLKWLKEIKEIDEFKREPEKIDFERII